MVRQLDPTSKGMPLEIYCFTYEKHGKNMKESPLIFWSFINYYVSISIRNFLNLREKILEA
jgi:hypothetical protein